MPNPTILKAAKAPHLKPVIFQRFDRRPHNYFRDMIHAEQTAEATESVATVFDAAQDAQRERERLQAKHEADTRTAVDDALARERADAQAELKKAVDLLNGYVRIMRAQVEELKGRIERQSVELAFEIAAKVIGAHIEAQPETVSKMVKDAVAQLVDVSRITIRVHPDDLDLIRGAAKKWYQDGDISTQAEIRPDSSLARGDSMIESERGITDARVSSQIARLQREAHNES